MLVFRGVTSWRQNQVPWKFPQTTVFCEASCTRPSGKTQGRMFSGRRSPKVWWNLVPFFCSVARHDYQSQHFDSKLGLVGKGDTSPIVEGCWWFRIDSLRGFLHQSQGIIKENHKWHNNDSDIRFTTQFLGNFSDWKLWMISDQDLTTPCSLFERFGVFFIALQASSYVEYVSIDGWMLYICRIDLNQNWIWIGNPFRTGSNSQRNASGLPKTPSGEAFAVSIQMTRCFHLPPIKIVKISALIWPAKRSIFWDLFDFGSTTNYRWCESTNTFLWSDGPIKNPRQMLVMKSISPLRRLP